MAARQLSGRVPPPPGNSPAISHGDLGDRGDRHDTAYRLAAHPELGVHHCVCCAGIGAGDTYSATMDGSRSGPGCDHSYRVRRCRVYRRRCVLCAAQAESDSRLVRVPRGVSPRHGHRVRLPRRGDLSDCLRAVGLRTVRAAQQTTRTPSIHEYFQAVRAICAAVPAAVTISIPLSAPSTS